MAPADTPGCSAPAPFDLIQRLAGHHLLLVVEEILQHAGYATVVNMLQVCQSWHALLTDLGLWRRMLERRYHADPAFRRLCSLNGWEAHFRRAQDQARPSVDAKTLAYIFFASTDLRHNMKSIKSDDAIQIKTYDFINTLLLHRRHLICGMINGRVKLWSLLPDHRGVSSSTPATVLEGHTKSVFAMCARDHLLYTASGGLDKTIRVWDLDQGVQLRSVSYENALNCQKMCVTEAGQLVLWYKSEGVANRAFPPRGELVAWDVRSVDRMAVDDNVVVNSSLRHERVKHGDVSEDFSVVAYPSEFVVYANDAAERRFVRSRARIAVPENHWTYLVSIYRKLLLAVFRQGDESVHGLIDDTIHVFDLTSGDDLYQVAWKWRIFSPLKSLHATDFGLIATNTSERAYVWHWDDVATARFEKGWTHFDVAPSRQSSFVMQWRYRANSAINAKAAALVNEQRSHVYIVQY